MFRHLSRTVDNQGLIHSSLHDNDTFYKKFTKDLRSAKQHVYIESPFITRRRTTELIPEFARLVSMGTSVTVNTRHPEEHEGEYVDQASEMIAEMQQLGVKVLYTVKHHRKLAIIDDTLWEGSLNILSQNDSCEIMRRSVSSKLVDQMAKFVRIAKYA